MRLKDKYEFLKGALSGLREFSATESPLKMMKNVYMSSQKLFSFSKRLDYKDQVYFKFCDVTTWLTNNCNTHITQYFEK